MMKPKTLDEVIEKMRDNGFWRMSIPVKDECEKYMRLACEAMVSTIVPEMHHEHSKEARRDGIDYENLGYNKCRSEIHERAEKFMKGEK